MKLLVGSIFINDSEYQCKLLDLQLSFLQATTQDFNHFAFISAGLTNNYFLRRTQVGVPEDKTLTFADAHLNGLQSLLKLFREKSDEYEYFLILDSDAFPIKKNWLQSLLSKMNPTYFFDNNGNYLFQTKQELEVAVILRSENLETRLHASVLFARRNALPYLDFSYASVGRDLLHHMEKDICIPAYQFERRNKVFPLIRSNKVNIHPLACGIYFDSFYHHAAGSRDSLLVRGNNYWDAYYKVHMDHAFTSQLFDNPCQFVSMLAGWSQEKYPEVLPCDS